MRLFSLATFFTVILSLCEIALADPYRLSIGDHLVLDYNFIDAPRDSVIDLDGNIRLPELGSIQAQGRTLDEMESEIGARMLDGGFTGIPTVSLEIMKYAPVVVAGLAEKGGRFDYVPGMTVGVALAMAGGGPALENSGGSLEVAAMAARRRALEYASQISTTILLIARLEARFIDLDSTLTLDATTRSLIPGLSDAEVDLRLRGEQDILESQRRADEALEQSWAQELAEGRDQIDLLDQRIALKAEVISQLVAEVNNASTLQQQGLVTNARTLAAVQRLADEREDLLALETAKLSTKRAMGMTERNRLTYYQSQNQVNLETLQAARNKLDSLRQSYHLSLSEIALLSGGLNHLDDIPGGLVLAFTIKGPRQDNFEGRPVTEETLLRPGDILVVSADLD